MSLRIDIQKALSSLEVSFHMPGHKYKGYFESVPAFDTTEVYGTDNLHNPKGAILDAEIRASNYYGSKRTRFLVGGSTSGILSAIYGASEYGNKIIMGRDSHKSVYNACKISGLNYITVAPDICEASLPYKYGSEEESFLNALRENPDVKICLLTSPNYYGYVVDTRKIAEEMKARNGLLIVDEAHGAHLEFCSLRSYSALYNGAQVVIQSVHKTLPGMTMGALLHYGDSIDEEYFNGIELALRMFQSSSPSYPIMYSIDDALEYMDKNREENALKIKLFKDFRASLPLDFISGIPLPEDPTKIFLRSDKIGYSGYELNEILREKGIFAEFAMENGVLIYLSVLNSEDELRALSLVLKAIKPRRPLPCKGYLYPKVDIGGSKRRSKKIEIPLSESVGQVSAEDVIPYPPGIPIILRGEIINSDVIDAITCYNGMKTIMVLD